MVSPSYDSNIGGAENQLKKLLNLLKKENVTIISKKTEKCNNLLYPYNFHLKTLFSIIKNKYKIIHIHTFSSPAWVIALCNSFLNRKILIKITLSGNNSRLEKICNSYFLKALFNFFFKSEDIYFVSLNKKIKKNLIKLGIKKSKIFNIPNGVANLKNKPSERKKIDLIFFGRLIKRKNIFKLLELMYQKKLNYIKFDIYGEGPEKKFIKSYIVEKKLKNISLKSFVSNKKIIDKLKKSKFTINVSEAEGMSNSILESISQGVPVICTNIQENRYLIKNYYNGYLFKDKKGLYKILKNLHNLKNYQKISINAFNSAKPYDIKNIAEIYKKKYKKLLTKN